MRRFFSASAWKEAIPEKDLDRLTLTYKVLGDATRLKIGLAHVRE